MIDKFNKAKKKKNTNKTKFSTVIDTFLSYIMYKCHNKIISNSSNIFHDYTLFT